jgi:hypothetical protein
MGWGSLLVLLLASSSAVAAEKCLTEQDVLDARCDTACAREGYSSGRFADQKCLCIDAYEVSSMIKKKLKLPKKIKAPESDYFRE